MQNETINQQLTKEDLSYFSEFLKSYNSQLFSGANYLLSPQLLNLNLKDINMGGITLSESEIRKMVLNPHRYEQELRKLSLHFYETVSIYKRQIQFESNVLDFDWEPIPYRKDGKEITISDMRSDSYQRDYAKMAKFFNSFNVKKEFKKVFWNMRMYDTFYTSVREQGDYIYLQELPSSHCIIDADSYLGYLFSFDMSYFTNSGVDINAYSPAIRKKYREVIELKSNEYNTNLPDRNGAWVYWHPMSPDDSWVFKFNNGFAGSVPPLLDMFLDYTKLDKYKDLEEQKKQLEAYKVIFATVPRLSNNKSGNKVDDFAISAEELGKFVSAVKDTLKVDFKAAPLTDFKAFDFSPSSGEDDLLETEINNMLMQSGLTNAILNPKTVNVASAGLYKTVTSAQLASVYEQFATFCEHQVNKRTRKFKFKIKFLGTIFDREERRKNADTDMSNGIITPAIFSSRGIQLTDAKNVTNMMYAIGFPDSFKPVQTSATLSSKDKGKEEKPESELTDSGAKTRTAGSNEGKKAGGL